jgi:transcriptional regulator with XRE-family HTH domain
MREDQRMARFTPPTPRSRRLGRELRRLREAANLTLEAAGKETGSSGSRIQRIESGDIKARPGDVLELLKAYGIPLDGDLATELSGAARDLREAGWWQRLGLSSRYATYIAYEAEATHLRNFEPTLVPGLLQTADYARAVAAVAPDAEPESIEEHVGARLRRQEVLTRKQRPLRLHAILSEAALMVTVGGDDVLRQQLRHIVEVGRRPNITIQVLRFAAGEHLADHGGFAILSFERQGDPPLGYIETLAGELFLEGPKDIDRLIATYEHLQTLAMSPAESLRFIREKVDGNDHLA